MNCVSCGDPLSDDRAEVKDYCLKEDCFRANYRPLKMVSISQTKTNAEITILTPEVERAMAEGKYRRDPIVVGRQRTTAPKVEKVQFRQAKQEQVSVARVRFVQALQAQGLRVDEIVGRGAHMRLTRSEVVKYMAARRV